jgi:predicted CoA-binding protein
MSLEHSTSPSTAPDAPSDDELRTLLQGVKSIAVIGASMREARPAHYVPAYLQSRGYDVAPVNPAAAGQELFGHTAVSSLPQLQTPVDLVNVFRRNEDIPGHLDEILALTPLPRAVWIQLGLRHDATAEALRQAGITVIQDRCIMVEHRRLLGADRASDN